MNRVVEVIMAHSSTSLYNVSSRRNATNRVSRSTDLYHDCGPAYKSSNPVCKPSGPDQRPGGTTYKPDAPKDQTVNKTAVTDPARELAYQSLENYQRSILLANNNCDRKLVYLSLDGYRRAIILS